MFATILKVQVRKIRILAVDHNPLLLEGLSFLIQLEPDMDLVGAVASGEEAVDWFRREKPDVTLMDLDLPSGAGVTAIRKILKIDPATCVLGLMTYEEDESGTHAFAVRRPEVPHQGPVKSGPRARRAGLRSTGRLIRA